MQQPIAGDVTFLAGTSAALHFQLEQMLNQCDAATVASIAAAGSTVISLDIGELCRERADQAAFTAMIADMVSYLKGWAAGNGGAAAPPSEVLQASEVFGYVSRAYRFSILRLQHRLLVDVLHTRTFDSSNGGSIGGNGNGLATLRGVVERAVQQGVLPTCPDYWSGWQATALRAQLQSAILDVMAGPADHRVAHSLWGILCENNVTAPGKWTPAHVEYLARTQPLLEQGCIEDPVESRILTMRAGGGSGAQELPQGAMVPAHVFHGLLSHVAVCSVLINTEAELAAAGAAIRGEELPFTCLALTFAAIHASDTAAEIQNVVARALLVLAELPHVSAESAACVSAYLLAGPRGLDRQALEQALCHGSYGPLMSSVIQIHAESDDGDDDGTHDDPDAYALIAMAPSSLPPGSGGHQPWHAGTLTQEVVARLSAALGRLGRFLAVQPSMKPHAVFLRKSRSGSRTMPSGSKRARLQDD